MKQYMSVKQASELAGVSESTIRRMEARGDLPSRRFGRVVRIRVDSIAGNEGARAARYMGGAW